MSGSKKMLKIRLILNPMQALYRKGVGCVRKPDPSHHLSQFLILDD